MSALGLAEKHAGLPEAMEIGFHIGDLAPITTTIIHPNYPAANEHMAFIEEYVNEQVALGRMTGPYPRAEVERILGSPFISSPLSVVPKANGKLRLVQDCSKEDEDGLSVNGRINTDLFPTKWGSAAEVAELVSPFFFRFDSRGQRAKGAARSSGHRRITRAKGVGTFARARGSLVSTRVGTQEPTRGRQESQGTQEPLFLSRCDSGSACKHARDGGEPDD